MSLHAYASRDSPPSHTLLDQNLDPRVQLPHFQMFNFTEDLGKNELFLRGYIKLVRGGPNFDPVKYVKEVSHVEHMHTDSLFDPPQFLFEINDHVTKTHF